MARVRLRQRRDVEAAEEALNAVGLERFLHPGAFLSRRGTEPGWAFQACGAGLPDHPGDGARFRSRASLAGRIHSRPRGDKARAHEHRDWLREHRRHRRAAAAAS